MKAQDIQMDDQIVVNGQVLTVDFASQGKRLDTGEPLMSVTYTNGQLVVYKLDTIVQVTKKA